MGSNYEDDFKYKVDVVMCIDATGSMSPFLELVKKNALSFYEDLRRTMENLDTPKVIDQFRIRIIAFRDYLADGKDAAMLRTDFFKLPEQTAEFEAAVKSIKAAGGGDDPEDALEALGYAMKSKWTDESEYCRHIITLWTDAPAHKLGFGRDPENGKYLTDSGRTPRLSVEQVKANAAAYPEKMAKDFDELTRWWGVSRTDKDAVMKQRNKRMVIYAPLEGAWLNVRDAWNQTVFYPSTAGTGLKDIQYQEILSLIANSI